MLLPDLHRISSTSQCGELGRRHGRSCRQPDHHPTRIRPLARLSAASQIHTRDSHFAADANLPAARRLPDELARPAASLEPVKPEPLVITWQATEVRVRHDDPRLTESSPGVARLCSAVALARAVEGLRLILVTTMGDRYRAKVRDDGAVVGLWRRG